MLPTTAPANADVPDLAANACFHGGAFFETVGDEFQDLNRRESVINADVLDAWFPPAPTVISALSDHLPWLLKTSPPTHSQGLVRAIARARGVPARCVLPGAGSSDLIFLALRHWLTPGSRVLLLDPTYGEYAHVCERVIGCTADRLALHRQDNFRLDLERLESRLQEAYDLVVLVNPNNPTGQHLDREDLETILRRMPADSRCWVDEAYVDYAGPDQSLEKFAASSRNVVVCKSLSKACALSGVRAAYLIGNKIMVDELRALTPPWAVSLPAQVAAVHALQAPEYYADCYVRTRELQRELARGIRRIDPDGEVIAGVGNWILWYPSCADEFSAAELIHSSRHRGLFVRQIPARGGEAVGRSSAGAAGEPSGDAIRIAVKDSDAQARIIEILAAVLADRRESSRQIRAATG